VIDSDTNCATYFTGYSSLPGIPTALHPKMATGSEMRGVTTQGLVNECNGRCYAGYLAKTPNLRHQHKKSGLAEFAIFILQ
jgi:hypothetical protein